MRSVNGRLLPTLPLPHFLTRDSSRQAAAVDQLYGKVILALVRADFVDRDDVRVVEVGGGLSLGLETLLLGCAREFPGANHLERHDAVETDLACSINHAHAAARNDFQ